MVVVIFVVAPSARARRRSDPPRAWEIHLRVFSLVCEKKSCHLVLWLLENLTGLLEF